MHCFTLVPDVPRNWIKSYVPFPRMTSWESIATSSLISHNRSSICCCSDRVSFLKTLTINRKPCIERAKKWTTRRAVILPNRRDKRLQSPVKVVWIILSVWGSTSSVCMHINPGKKPDVSIKRSKYRKDLLLTWGLFIVDGSWSFSSARRFAISSDDGGGGLSDFKFCSFPSISFWDGAGPLS